MSEVNNLRSLLHSLCNDTEGETVSVRDMLNAVGRRSYGPVLLLLGFIAVSPLTLIPGANSFVAVLILIFAIQIVIGRQYPWIPKKALDFSFPRKHLVAGVGAMAKHTHTVDALLKPRLIFLTKAPFVQIVALACVAAALITIPLSFVPLGPILPSLTVLFFGLALTARDGFVLVLAGAALTAATVVLYRVWNILSFDMLPFIGGA